MTHYPCTTLGRKSLKMNKEDLFDTVETWNSRTFQKNRGFCRLLYLNVTLAENGFLKASESFVTSFYHISVAKSLDEELRTGEVSSFI